MKIVLLNGPPKCGKDTIGKLLTEPMRALRLKFAQPIIDHMATNFGVSCVDGGDKDAPLEVLNGMSRRQYAIAYSEEWIKPRLGKDWFGRYAARQVLRFWSESSIVFTDSGFVEEVGPIAKQVGLPGIVQVKIHRPGYDFNGDSRSYWSYPGMKTIDFHNDCDLGELFNVVRSSLVPEIDKCLLY